jgi:hypothetical protein
MTLRHSILGLAVVFAISVWAWARSEHRTTQPANSEPGLEASTTNPVVSRNQSEAAYRFRMNQSHHWRQVALGR